MAATNKCLAESNKSPDGPGATKNRRAALDMRKVAKLVRKSRARWTGTG
jgi:hypothetical protein